MGIMHNHHEFDVSYIVDGIKLVIDFVCNFSRTEIYETFKLATKLYDFSFEKLPEYATAHTTNNNETLTAFHAEFTARLYEMFVNDADAIKLLRKSETDGSCIMTQYNIIILMMHYVRLLLPDLTWAVTEVHIQKA